VGVAGADAFLVWENIGEATLGSAMEAKEPPALKGAAAAMRMRSNTADATAFKVGI
jgi:hypothetical protein